MDKNVEKHKISQTSMRIGEILSIWEIQTKGEVWVIGLKKLAIWNIHLKKLGFWDTPPPPPSQAGV